MPSLAIWGGTQKRGPPCVSVTLVVERDGGQLLYSLEQAVVITDGSIGTPYSKVAKLTNFNTTVHYPLLYPQASFRTVS